MRKMMQAVILATLGLMVVGVGSAGAATSKIGVLAIDDFLMGDVNTPSKYSGGQQKRSRLSLGK